MAVTKNASERRQTTESDRDPHTTRPPSHQRSKAAYLQVETIRRVATVDNQRRISEKIRIVVCPSIPVRCTCTNIILPTMMRFSLVPFALLFSSAAAQDETICTSDTNTFTFKVNLYESDGFHAGRMGEYRVDYCIT